ncbi:bifunctional folylpolyglutamate synthase/dihydrofolate synthase [Lysinibacillus sp. LZ02]|uniref:bifunctional folylpolyglutamate synthase/dihydrofolate synthase n=1 Tax=Lysinibacillus sp. LZ02 TaxID=3420668 RepID=UPI003D35F6B9
MFQSMKDCTEYIFALKASQYKGEPLESARKILQALSNPQQKTKFIHFAGSNGKGSTLNATREILMNHGLTVGAFISPHLERANERITINKQQISDEDFVRYANAIVQIIERDLEGKFPSFFEFVTLVMFQHFAAQQVDVALIETGIGGRLDSTNVLVPEVSVITTISLEHTEMLGDTYEEIANEKAGIIKAGKAVVVGVRHIEARNVICERAQEKNAPLYMLEQTILLNKNATEQTFTYEALGRKLEDVYVKMAGTHQLDNAALAITAALLFDSSISDQVIRESLGYASWDGRFERMTPQIILDGAHNSEGTAALLATLAQVAPHKHYKFVYAALQDKDHRISIHMMDAVAAEMHFTEITLPRAATAEALAKESTHAKKFIHKDWRSLLREQIAQIAQEELLIITGSLYFIAEARTFLQEELV